MGKLTKAIVEFQKKYINPPNLQTKENKTREWVVEQLSSQGWIWDGKPPKVGDKMPQVKHLPLDSNYTACSKKEFMEWVEWDWVDKKQYVAEKYDCENFAFSFKARTDRRFGINTVGFVLDYSGGHAYNVVLFTDSPPLLYEPQSDAWVQIGEGTSATEIYKMQAGYIII